MTQQLYFPNRSPTDVTDFVYDWSHWLGASDSLQSVTVVANPSDLIVSEPLVLGDAVTVWLSGGTSGVTYTVSCTVVSQAGRTATRSAQLYTVSL